MTLLAQFGFSSKTAEEIKNEIAQEDSAPTFEPLLKNEFKVTADKNDSGVVIARILPGMEKFKVNSPHVKVRKHFFSYKGVVYDSLCHGWSSGDCPLCNFIKETGINKRDSTSPYKKFNFGVWENQKMVAPRFASTEEEWVNIYVKSDVNDPTNNHKVFQYKLPKAIFKSYEGYINGDARIGQAPESVHDIFTGRDLQISFCKKDGFRTYEASKFNDKSVLSSLSNGNIKDNAEAFLPIFEDMQDLHELIDPETRMYTPEEAQAKFDEVMKIINEEMAGGEGGSFSSKDIGDGFDSVDLKKGNGTVSKSDLDDLTSGKFDSNPTKKMDVDNELEDMLATEANADSFDDLDDLLG